MLQPRPWEIDWKSYDWLVFNTSAGKDSQCMMDYCAPYIEKAGKTDRTIAVHADMGRCEWGGTLELAQEQAEHYGFRFEVVRRKTGDLLQHVRERGMWPDRLRRYCTSDHKTNQCHQVITSLSREARQDHGIKHLKILYMLGIRSDESEERRLKDPFVLGCTRSVCKACKGLSVGGKRKCPSPRTVHTYLPIFDWSEDEVWHRIRRSKVRYHSAYDLGMRRLSCVFCIFATRSALVLAGHHNRELLEEYVKVEKEIGHSFRYGLPMVEVKRAVERGEGGEITDSGDWCM